MDNLSKIKKKGKLLLIIDNLLIVLGFNLVFPLISIHFIDSLGWSASFVGFCLGSRQIVQQGFGIVGGAIADKIGAKPLVICGLFLRSIGFFVMAVSNSYFLLFISCILSALGGLFFDPALTALAVKLTTSRNRGRFISLLMIENNTGAVIGALIGSFLIIYDFSYVCIFSAVIFFICAIINMIYMPNYHLSSNHNSILDNIKTVCKDKIFLKYVFSLTGYYILYVQVMLMWPLIIVAMTGNVANIKLMYMIQAIVSCVLLYPIARYTEKRYRLDSRVYIGIIFISLAFLSVVFITNYIFLLICIAIYYLAIVTVEPARETLILFLTNKQNKGGYVGLGRIGFALGGFIGYTGAGWLYDISTHNSYHNLPWMIMSVIGLTTSFTIYKIFKNNPPVTKL